MEFKKEKKVRHSSASEFVRFGVFDITANLDRLSAKQLDNIKEHKYSSSGNTIIDPLIQPLWTNIAANLPLNLAPNMITLVALMVNLLGFLSLFYYGGQNGAGKIPSWAYYFCGLSLFIYQTLDAVDGKQARRLNMSGPLGELFDHGMDSISTFLISTSIGLTILAVKEPGLMLSTVVVSMSLFYISHWVSYATGTLHFGKFDVTEAQWSSICIFTMTGFLGPQIWSVEVRNGYLVRHFLLAFVYVGAFYTFVRCCRRIYAVGYHQIPGSTDTVNVLAPGANIIVISFVTIMVGMRTDLYIRHPVIFVLYFGLLTAKITNKLIIATMTKSELRLTDPSLWSPVILMINQYYDGPIPEDELFFLMVIYSAFDLIRFLCRTYVQISKALKINILTVKKIN